MPNFRVSPNSIVNQIKGNLQDRYDSGFPVLKELLQNADDSRARKIYLDALPGWHGAVNPLLCGPGLLVFNDGEFREDDERGIVSFGESGKATDSAAIGKFGIGQKAVFHLCDAFVVCAFGSRTSFNTVINPFLNVEVAGNVTEEWDQITESDLDLLRRSVVSDFPSGLILWLPFRREGLEPASGVSFSTNKPTSSQTISELTRPDELRAILTALRHLESVELREAGRLRCSVSVQGTAGRLLGPDRWPAGLREFGGTIKSDPPTSTARFVGREATIPDARLERLRRTPHWPKTISVFDAQPQPEKGEPHAAATLLRAPHNGVSQLKISWAVFLPTAEAADTVLPLDGVVLGQFQLLLHGYFFLDSGRRHIEGLADQVRQQDPVDPAGLRRAWNAELRDSVALPLVPGVLRDTLDAQMVTSAELAGLVAAIANSPWFLVNRGAVCRTEALARVFEPPSGVVWRLVPPVSELRPLPKVVADVPARLTELFPDIHDWSRAHDIFLCVDERASLTSERMHWRPDELASLFSKLSPRALHVGALAPLLTEFLTSVEPDEAVRQAVGPHLSMAMRKAMGETSALASTEHLSAILAYVPQELLFRLPPSVEHRQVLRALASASAGVLPVRGAWLQDTHRSPRLSDADLKSLLGAVEPLIDGENADQAATAALDLLLHAEREIPDLAREPEFSSIKVLRGRSLRAGGLVAVSLQALLHRSQEGLLFVASPDANKFLPPLTEALPDADPLIVEGKTAEFLKERGRAGLSVNSAGKASVFALINKASRFGPESARSRLLEQLRPSDEDDRAALRRLCAGVKEAGVAGTDLWILDGAPAGVERIVTNILSQSASDFLVPSRIASDLTPRVRAHLGIRTLDTPGLEALLEKNADVIPKLEPTETEREAFLLTGLSDALLRRLPIHSRSDGSVGTAENVFREVHWPIPLSLREHVLTIRPCQHPEALERQQKLISAWSPQAQIETALSRLQPHVLRMEILDALGELFDQNENLSEDLTDLLRKTSWLVAEGAPIAPKDVLALPQSVDDAARAVLLSAGERPPFFPANKLPIDVREHPAFVRVEKHVLPDRRFSFDALTLMIEEKGVAGRLGEAENHPLEDFTVLANAGADLVLPGWALLAAILTSIQEDREQIQKAVSAFSQVSSSGPDMAASHLDALAALANESGRKAEAARRAYLHGFDAVVAWPEDLQRRVFGGTRVPNKAGGWRSGCEVLEDGDGIAPTHVLASDFASRLKKRRGGSAQQSIGGGTSSDSDPATLARRGGAKPVDLAKLEAECAKQHREFLQPWRGRVPSDLVIIYLGFIGRFRDLRQLADEWATDATTDVDTLWADLDRCLKPALHPDPLPKEVDQRRFVIEKIDGGQVRATAMSGDIFNVPLGDGTGRILVGNLHKQQQAIRSADGIIRVLITLPLLRLDVSAYGQRDACAIFRNFVETVSADCLWLRMSNQQDAVRDILDKAVEVDQATLEETDRLLRDRLPTILAELKLPTEYRSQKALREYQEAEGRVNRLSGSADDKDKLKIALWESIRDEHAAAELLASLRVKIRDLGYSPSRVLFELFQNADDAYRQLGTTEDEACFRIERVPGHPGGFRVVHWGRPINHLGSNADEGRRLGHDRDLLNMLVMNFSEKRADEDLTGKFGLGFKSVHVLSDSVGIASGFIAMRTLGGFLPEVWPDGLDEVERRKKGNGRKATIIDVPFTSGTAEDGEEAAGAFRAAMTWLPAFARSIKRIEITDIDPVSIECRASPLLGDDAIDVVLLHGTRRQRALRFKLSDRYGLLLKIDAAGPEAFAEEFRRLWNLAPLEEDLHSGWLLNGPFAVDPGRGRLSGSIASRQDTFKRLGRKLGERLLRLHDLAAGDWASFAATLDLDTSESVAQSLFWSRLFDVIGRDFDDDLAQYLHADGQGYGRLATERAVVPTHLPKPFDGLVRASEVDHFTDDALAEKNVLEKVRDWGALSGLQGRVVAPIVAEQLRKLGLGTMRPVTLSALLRHEMGNENRIDAALAEKLGHVITLEAIENEPLVRERKGIREVAKQAHFLAQDGAWRPVKDLNSRRCGSEDETMLCAFAPDSALLHDNYSDNAIEFFKVARAESGYGPKAALLLRWATLATAQERRRAALGYVVSGGQGRALAEAMRQDFPVWVPRPLENLLNDALLFEWNDEDKKRLLFELGGHLHFTPGISPEGLAKSEPQGVLKAIHDWWDQVKTVERAEYASRVYPEFFALSALKETEDRLAWFTMFALACFQSFGRTQDGQHRSYIEQGWRNGWWQELATSKPPIDVQIWVDRLEGWSSPSQFEQSFMPWKRAFVDLYTVARWLDEYIEVFRKLPRLVEHHGPISLNDVLRPSFSPLIMRLGVEAAPLSRSLGIGMNWMIRELLRGGVYEARYEGLMAPYCWAPAQRVRDLLKQFGKDVGDAADKEASRAIHEFIVGQIGDDLARFDGDFDLPLQMITREENRESLRHCFDVTGQEAPDFLDADFGVDANSNDETEAQ